MKTDYELQRTLMCRCNSLIKLPPDVKTDEIEVSVVNGIVNLKGSVPTYEDKWSILRAVRGETGVIAWADEIVVNLPDDLRRTDAEIAAAARDAINTITTVPADSIMIDVQDGWLTLAGLLDHLYQKECVEYAVVGLTGLTGVLNLISVKQQ